MHQASFLWRICPQRRDMDGYSDHSLFGQENRLPSPQAFNKLPQVFPGFWRSTSSCWPCFSDNILVSRRLDGLNPCLGMAIGISTIWNIKKHDNLYITIHHKYSSYKIIKMQHPAPVPSRNQTSLAAALVGTPHQGQECCLHWIRRWAAGRKPRTAWPGADFCHAWASKDLCPLSIETVSSWWNRDVAPFSHITGWDCQAWSSGFHGTLVGT